ncbi:IclR family transcriptional regulator [Roseomonas sp. E05]|uniref:IclR family transcriptional regulator n=1 Tax=Roseomonas sp. E05 TaxID=3046310 RepID=UPI0024BB3E0A|nr:IclR family transcriptional regulator [Roseomonas sp. E05]MDJ0387952.1 IclR family transcriptional regulator [Roseomonas sp. E05]
METVFSPPTRPAEVVKSADRVLDLLELLGCAPRPLTLAEITQDLGIPKSSALALLRTLAARGYAARDESDRYALAPPFGREAGDWLGGLPRQVLATAQPVMLALVEQTRETVNLGVMRDGFMVRPLLQVPSPQEIRYEPRAVDCPAYCTAMGRILLAHAPAENLRRCLAPPLARLTPFTETDPARLRVQIAAALAQGYAEIDSEYAEGGAGVAAPVFDRAGQAVAALNLASLTERWQRHRQDFIAAVTGAAATVTRRIGGRAPEQRN